MLGVGWGGFSRVCAADDALAAVDDARAVSRAGVGGIDTVGALSGGRVDAFDGASRTGAGKVGFGSAVAARWTVAASTDNSGLGRGAGPFGATRSVSVAARAVLGVANATRSSVTRGALEALLGVDATSR